MSAPNLPENTPAAGSPGSSAPPSGTEPAKEWRVPENDPRPWARGKNAAELLSLTDQAIGYLQAQQAQQPAYQPPPPPVLDPTQIRDDDFVDGKTLKTYLQQVAQPVQHGFEHVYSNLASNALNQAKAKHSDAFERYGGEIQDLVQRIPLASRSLDNIELTIDLVMGKHRHDEAKRLEAKFAGDPTLRGSSSGNYGISANGQVGGPTVKSDELPPDYRALLERKGLNDEKLREFFVTMNMGPDDQKKWWDQAKKHNMNVITERSSRGF